MARNRSDKDRRGGIAIQTGALGGLKAVVFDLDGTLCTYLLSVAEVFDAAVRRLGVDPNRFGDLDELAERYAALWTEVQPGFGPTEEIRLHIVEQLLAERGVNDPSLAQPLSDAYGAVRDESGLRSFDGAIELLRDLRPRYTLGLLTNGPSDIQWEKIRSLRIETTFDAIVVAGDVGIYKPDVRVFRILLDRLDVTADAALFVGDNFEMDIVGANTAGMKTAWIRTNGARPTGGVLPDVEVAEATVLREVLL